MMHIEIKGTTYEVECIAFDKDGLLFESQAFWIELARGRTEAMKACEYIKDEVIIRKWMDLTGVLYIEGESGFEVCGLDPYGIFAIASVDEEIIVMATLLYKYLDLEWVECRRVSNEIFIKGDKIFVLDKALKPKKGFPDIFLKLRKAGIKYGVATSDTYDRVKSSVELYDEFEKVEFVITSKDVQRGKPYPDMLQIVQKLVNVPMDKIAMVGDSVVDVQMAYEAGAIGIGIPDNEKMKRKMEPYATEIIENLGEIIVKEG